MKEITRDKFRQFHFCTKFFDENGGQPDKRPAWFEADDGQGGKVQRVYVSASWFPTWEKWQPMAALALDAAVTQFDAYHDRYTKIGTSYPLAGEPHFLLEKDGIWAGDFLIWINALCPSEFEFERVVAEAHKRIANHGKPVTGMRIASITAPLPLLPFPSEWCQSKPQTVGASWGK